MSKAAITEGDTVLTAELDPDYETSVNNLWVLRLKRWAIEYYNNKIEANPKNADAYIGKGDILFILEEKRAAIEYYDKAIAIDPKNDKAYGRKGRALDDLGEKQAAIECYDMEAEIIANYTTTYKVITQEYLKPSTQAAEGLPADSFVVPPSITDQGSDDFNSVNPALSTLLGSLAQNYQWTIECFDKAVKELPADSVTVPPSILDQTTVDFGSMNPETPQGLMGDHSIADLT